MRARRAAPHAACRRSVSTLRLELASGVALKPPRTCPHGAPPRAAASAPWPRCRSPPLPRPAAPSTAPQRRLPPGTACACPAEQWHPTPAPALHAALCVLHGPSSPPPLAAAGAASGASRVRPQAAARPQAAGQPHAMVHQSAPPPQRLAAPGAPRSPLKPPRTRQCAPAQARPARGAGPRACQQLPFTVSRGNI